MPCAGNVPVIVAGSTFSQPSGGTIAQTTIYTPSSDGLFRFSAYATSGSSFVSPTFTVRWTDDNGGRSQTNLWHYNVATNSLYGELVISAAAGNDISIEFDTTGTSAYTLQYTLEQLS